MAVVVYVDVKEVMHVDLSVGKFDVWCKQTAKAVAQARIAVVPWPSNAQKKKAERELKVLLKLDEHERNNARVNELSEEIEKADNQIKIAMETMEKAESSMLDAHKGSESRKRREREGARRGSPEWRSALELECAGRGGVQAGVPWPLCPGNPLVIPPGLLRRPAESHRTELSEPCSQ